MGVTISIHLLYILNEFLQITIGHIDCFFYQKFGDFRFLSDCLNHNFKKLFVKFVSDFCDFASSKWIRKLDGCLGDSLGSIIVVEEKFHVIDAHICECLLRLVVNQVPHMFFIQAVIYMLQILCLTNGIHDGLKPFEVQK